ncbi:MAG: serine/threonine protein kinase [Planctomycetaceae bacterium]|nr:serine/threonine protein kinase [Planctomycetaceae bacterium]
MNLDVRFELLDTIGSGSYATVYRARDKELGREVAVKQIHAQFLADPRTLDRYWAEAQLLASLHHPNIVTIFDIVRDRGWLIMELMQGSLKQRLEGRQMDLRSLRASLAHCLRALKYLHERGVIHGDIKPGNMMIDHRKRVKLGDFGLARRVSDDDGSLLKGTAKYIAPEVVSDEFGDVGPHSDLYALGFSAYELMCGSDNFEDLFPGLSAFGRDKQAAWMMWHAAPDRRLPDISRVLDGVPPDLAHVIQKLVEKNPAKRYRTADEALSDLNVDLKIIGGAGSGDEDVETPPTLPKPGGTRPLVYVVFAISMLLSLAMFFLPNSGSQTAQGPAKTTLGVVRTVDAGTGEMEYEDPQSGVPALLNLPEGTKILLLETGAEKRFILPRDIQSGDWVEIEQGADSNGQVALNLTVSRPTTSTGTIRSVDPAAHKIVIAVKEGPIRDDVSLDVPEGAKLQLNAAQVPLSELAEGDVVEIQHVLDPAGQIGHILSDLAAKRRAEFAAFVESVDMGRREMHLSFGRGGGPVRVLPLADDAEIAHKSGETLSLDQLRPGDRLTVDADDRIHKLVVTREDLQLSGTLAAIDPAQRTLDVQLPDGTRSVLTVSADAEVTLGLQPANLDDLRLEIDSVTVSYRESPDGGREALAVDVHRGKRHDRWGLLIGTQAFADRAVARLPYAAADAQLVFESLTNRYAMEPDWTSRLLDRNRTDASREATRLLDQVGPQAQVIVFVATQAYVGPDGNVYLAGSDFRFDDMPQTGLPLDALIADIERCQAKRKLLLLDIVHPVDPAHADLQPSLPDLLYQLKTPIVQTDIIGASSADERGLELPQDHHGAFAAFVAQGFAGAADADHNLDVTPDELFDYLTRQFAVLSLPGGKKQTPFRLQGTSTSTP